MFVESETTNLVHKKRYIYIYKKMFLEQKFISITIQKLKKSKQLLPFETKQIQIQIQLITIKYKLQLQL